MIRERTSAGVGAARAEGWIGGRRKKLNPIKRREIAESAIIEVDLCYRDAISQCCIAIKQTQCSVRSRQLMTRRPIMGVRKRAALAIAFICVLASLGITRVTDPKLANEALKWRSHAAR